MTDIARILQDAHSCYETFTTKCRIWSKWKESIEAKALEMETRVKTLEKVLNHVKLDRTEKEVVKNYLYGLKLNMGKHEDIKTAISIFREKGEVYKKKISVFES